MLGLLRIGYQLLSLSCIRYCVLGITSLGHRPYALDATSRATAGRVSLVANLWVAHCTIVLQLHTNTAALTLLDIPM